jgi:hypothetical protein
MMTYLSLVQTFLFVIFIVAATTKLFAIADFRKTLTNLDFGKRLSQWISYILPLVELIGAFSLIFLPIAGIWILLLLSLAFLIVIIRTLIAKKRVKCNCFGSLASGKLGLESLIRVIILISLLVILLLVNDAQTFSDISSFDMILESIISLSILFVYAVVQLYMQARKIFRDVN